MPRAVTTGAGSRLRLVVCLGCGFKARATRGAVAKVGALPTCGCGGDMTFDDPADVIAVFGQEAVEDHPAYIEEMEREIRRAEREIRSSGRQHRCGGCQRYIRRTNEECGCGFHNDIRGNRNLGRWVSGASYCNEARREAVPF